MYEGIVKEIFSGEQRFVKVEPSHGHPPNTIACRFKDQRAVVGRYIDPTVTVTVIPLVGTTVYFLIDYANPDTAFLWGVPQENIKIPVIEVGEPVVSTPDLETPTEIVTAENPNGSKSVFALCDKLDQIATTSSVHPALREGGAEKDEASRPKIRIVRTPEPIPDETPSTTALQAEPIRSRVHTARRENPKKRDVDAKGGQSPKGSRPRPNSGKREDKRYVYGDRRFQQPDPNVSRPETEVKPEAKPEDTPATERGNEAKEVPKPISKPSQAKNLADTPATTETHQKTKPVIPREKSWVGDGRKAQLEENGGRLCLGVAAAKSISQ